MSLFLQEDLRKTRENWWIKKGQRSANNEAADVLARWERAGKRSRVYEGEGECVCLKQQTGGGEGKWDHHSSTVGEEKDGEEDIINR